MSEKERERQEKRPYIDVVHLLPGPLAILVSNNFSPVTKIVVLNIKYIIFSGQIERPVAF